MFDDLNILRVINMQKKKEEGKNLFTALYTLSQGHIKVKGLWMCFGNSLQGETGESAGKLSRNPGDRIFAHPKVIITDYFKEN